MRVFAASVVARGRKIGDEVLEELGGFELQYAEKG